MWNTNQHQYAKEDDILHPSDGSNSQLDDLLDSWHEENYETKSNNILRLNDDCFYEIFSYLPVNDLGAVSETCRDFQRLSRWYFERLSKSFHLERKYFYEKHGNNSSVVNEAYQDFQRFSYFSFEEYKQCFNWEGRKLHNITHTVGIRLSDAKRFVRNFGQYLTKLSLKGIEFQYNEQPIRLLPLLDRYCTKLHDLLLDVTFTRRGNITQYERLNWNLHRLTILNYDGSREIVLYPIDVDSILTHFVSLKHLELIGVEWIVPEGTHLVKRYEKLESLSLRNFLLPRTDMFTSFLTENCQLKRVKFVSCVFSETESTENFTVTLPNLESFWLRSRDNKYIVEQSYCTRQMGLRLTNISGDISALKELLIDLIIFQICSLNPLFARLAEHNIIENISISYSYYCPNDSISLLCHDLCALTNLKVLIFEFIGVFNDDIIKKLACSLSNLTYVAFYLCDVDFIKIEKFMEYSHKVNTIALFKQKRYRYGDRYPVTNNPLTDTTFSSMVNARLRNKYNNETLSLLLNTEAFSLNTLDSFLLRDWEHVIKVLPC